MQAKFTSLRTFVLCCREGNNVGGAVAIDNFLSSMEKSQPRLFPIKWPEILSAQKGKEFYWYDGDVHRGVQGYLDTIIPGFPSSIWNLIMD
jgi:hypothetical protein